MDCSLPGSSVHGDSPGRNNSNSSSESSQPRDQTQVTGILGEKLPGKNQYYCSLLSTIIMNKKLNLSWGLVKTNNGLPWWLSGKETTCSVRDAGSIPGSGIFPGGGNGNPLQYSCWEILLTEEPGRLQSMGSQRVRHHLATEHTHTKANNAVLSLTQGWNACLRHLLIGRQVLYHEHHLGSLINTIYNSVCMSISNS